MSTKEDSLGFTQLAQHIRDVDGGNNFPDVDSFINSENIQLSSELREVWPAVTESQNARLEDLEAIFKSDGDPKRMEEALSSVRSFIAETNRIPEQLLRADDALNIIQVSKQNLSDLISDIERNMPK